jgi:hypothetical protein
MQTFLPYKDFEKSAKVLDYKRLGKQRVEGMQLVNAIENPAYGWQHHPITNMWRPYLVALKQYTNVVNMEWLNQGYKSSIPFYVSPLKEDFELPVWLGNEAIHSSHRANLLRKDYNYYSKYNWNDNPDNGYIWLDKDGNYYEQVAGTTTKIYL